LSAAFGFWALVHPVNKNIFKKFEFFLKKYQSNHACRFQSLIPLREVSKYNINICMSKSNRGKKANLKL
jgi:hypothetical protein